MNEGALSMSTQYIVGIVFVVRIGLGKVGWGLGLGWYGTGLRGR